jgi:hypothetical protein
MWRFPADVSQRIFAGRYPGYSKCNTRYHDLEHTTDTFLAMARLIHGAVEAGRAIDRHMVLPGLVGTLLHDIGYIQTDGDRAGTGAKYTAGSPTPSGGLSALAETTEKMPETRLPLGNIRTRARSLG